MGTREDYYKFTHQIFPYSLHRHGKMLIDQMLGDAKFFTLRLQGAWGIMELKDSKNRNAPPSFTLEVRNLTEECKIIILGIPEASQRMEAPYVGICFDRAGDIRYFTYEIGEGEAGEVLYFTCEWTPDMKHINYRCCETLDLEEFINTISINLVYEML
jgi:hypothetical protein